MRSRSKQCKLSSFGQPESAKQERKPKLSIFDLIHATEGSAALDLATDTPLSLSPKAECYKLPTGLYDLLPSGTVGIILKSSGLISQGFIVYSGIVGRWG